MIDNIELTVTFDYQQELTCYIDVQAATIRDNFMTAVVAGSIDTTSASVGPGTRSVTDTESKLSIGA